MRGKWYLFIIFIFSMFLVPCVYAEDCDSTDIKRLRVLADDVDISYEYLDNYYENDFLVNGAFKVYVNNLSDELYIIETSDNIDSRNFSVNDGSLSIEKMYSGVWKFNVYSKKCNKNLKNIRVKLPYYNSYYEDDICKDYKDKIDECSKLSDSVYTFSDVYAAINKKNDISDDNKDESKTNFFNSKFFYLISGSTLLIFIILIVVVIYRRKKRGQLE